MSITNSYLQACSQKIGEKGYLTHAEAKEQLKHLTRNDTTELKLFVDIHGSLALAEHTDCFASDETKEVQNLLVNTYHFHAKKTNAQKRLARVGEAAEKVHNAATYSEFLKAHRNFLKKYHSAAWAVSLMKIPEQPLSHDMRAYSNLRAQLQAAFRQVKQDCLHLADKYPVPSGHETDISRYRQLIPGMNDHFYYALCILEQQNPGAPIPLELTVGALSEQEFKELLKVDLKDCALDPWEANFIRFDCENFEASFADPLEYIEQWQLLEQADRSLSTYCKASQKPQSDRQAKKTAAHYNKVTLLQTKIASLPDSEKKKTLNDAASKIRRSREEIVPDAPSPFESMTPGFGTRPDRIYKAYDPLGREWNESPQVGLSVKECLSKSSEEEATRLAAQVKSGDLSGIYDSMKQNPNALWFHAFKAAHDGKISREEFSTIVLQWEARTDFAQVASKPLIKDSVIQPEIRDYFLHNIFKGDESKTHALEEKMATVAPFEQSYSLVEIPSDPSHWPFMLSALTDTAYFSWFMPIQRGEKTYLVVPSFTLAQAVLDVAFGEQAVKLAPRLHLSSWSDLEECMPQNARPFYLAAPSIKAFPHTFKGKRLATSLHDLYHAHTASYIRPKEREVLSVMLEAIRNCISQINKTAAKDKKERVQALTKLASEIADAEFVELRDLPLGEEVRWDLLARQLTRFSTSRLEWDTLIDVAEEYNSVLSRKDKNGNRLRDRLPIIPKSAMHIFKGKA